MFAILAEDRSDAEALTVLVKRISGNNRVSRKGYGGCGELCRKAWSHIVEFADQGATHFIICHDSDGNSPDEVREKVRLAVGEKIELKAYTHKIIIPVQELEAWIIADELAITKVIPTLVITPQAQPETINSPKEWLVRESQKGRSKPLYAPATWNVRVAAELNIEKVAKKCKSFEELVTFVKGG